MSAPAHTHTHDLNNKVTKLTPKTMRWNETSENGTWKKRQHQRKIFSENFMRAAWCGDGAGDMGWQRARSYSWIYKQAHDIATHWWHNTVARSHWARPQYRLEAMSCLLACGLVNSFWCDEGYARVVSMSFFSCVVVVIVFFSGFRLCAQTRVRFDSAASSQEQQIVSAVHTLNKK